ncbi:X-Pro dipeptidyl-peptidase [Luteolibacter sp. LG18]|nr:X-Pro dipeptidyl-peptidase [Luteolibacter sp. LG18]
MGGVVLALMVPGFLSAAGFADLLDEYKADHGDVAASYDVPYAAAALDRKDALTKAWQARLETVDYAKLDASERIDWHLLHAYLIARHGDSELERARWKEMEAMLAFLQPLQVLMGDRSARQGVNAEETAATLSAAAEALKELRKKLEQGHFNADNLKPNPVAAVRIAGVLDAMRSELGQWFSFYDGFQADFSWWTRQPKGVLDKELETTAAFFRKDLAGLKGEPDDPLIGDPIGKDALTRELAAEMIPYSAEELLAIAEKEFAWCEAEMAKAATAMGCKDGKEALAKVKADHAAPGGQAAVAQVEAEKAIRFLKDKDLVTVPPLAAETWGVAMLGVDAQKSLPYAAYSRPSIRVAYAHESMSHEDKLMAMRGNNAAFLHIVTPHELIPGHHLQSFMARRYATERQMFSTPFLVEGWALHWEMLLWDLGYTATPQEKVGALFWRMHRCARVIVSLKFHLGEMTPEQMVDFLVDRVGHERAGATSEVRRYIGDGYGPLYQAAYMTGGLQLRALYKELVGSGKMSVRDFHDRILHEGPVPIEMIRAALKGEKLPKDWKPAWRFAE